jgi:hypothetical protein
VECGQIWNLTSNLQKRVIVRYMVMSLTVLSVLVKCKESEMILKYKSFQSYIRFEVLTTMEMSMSIFWVVTPCVFVDRYTPTFRMDVLPPSSGLK